MSWLGELIVEAFAQAALHEPMDRAMRKKRWLRWGCYVLMALLAGLVLGSIARDYF